MVSKRSSQGAGSPQRRTSRWKVEYYVTGSGASPVLEWVKKLPEPKRVAWLAFVEFALVVQGKDIEQSGYVKPLGQGLFELRIDHDAAELAQVFGADLSAYPDLAGPSGGRDSAPGVLHLLRRPGGLAPVGPGQGSLSQGPASGHPGRPQAARGVADRAGGGQTEGTPPVTRPHAAGVG